MDDVTLTLKLAEKLGGRKALAKKLGIGVTAVNNWVSRERIGSETREKFRDLARDNGIRLPERWLWQSLREAA